MCWLIRVRRGRLLCNPERANDAVCLTVMAGLGPVITSPSGVCKEDMDDRDKPGHDAMWTTA